MPSDLDGHKTAESFFAGIVQGMHQIDGLLFLIFAERGLWNRFVPSLDGYIQDRLNNPVHVPQHGEGRVLRAADNEITVEFPNGEERTFLRSFVHIVNPAAASA